MKLSAVIKHLQFTLDEFGDHDIESIRPWTGPVSMESIERDGNLAMLRLLYDHEPSTYSLRYPAQFDF